MPTSDTATRRHGDAAIRFERTTDYDLVRAILTHPQLYPRMGDDATPPASEFIVNRHPDIWWVLAYDAGELAGLIPLFPENHICWDLHLALLPHTWGSVAHRVGREFIPWLWARTPCRRLVAHVPAWNKKVLGFLPRYMGMTRYGVNETSFLLGGILQDRIDFGISKPKEIQWTSN